MTTVHDPGPEPASDAGLIPPAGFPPPEVMDAAWRALWDGAGRQDITIPSAAFTAAVIAAVVTDRGLRDAAAGPGPDVRCGYRNCRHPYRDHIEPDACFAIDVATACNCQGFRP